MRRLSISIVILILFGCSSNDATDAANAADAADATADVGITVEDSELPNDVNRDPDADASSELDTGVSDTAVDDGGSDCLGSCATLELTASVGQNSARFDRAFYGLTSPERSDTGDWLLHVEAYAGGAEGCPQQDSPTPDQTLIVAGMGLPEAPSTVTESNGLVVSLIEFAGTLTEELPLRAMGEEVRFAKWQLCTDCSGDDPDGFVAFELVAPLEDGTIDGHVYATHCASLDAR